MLITNGTISQPGIRRRTIQRPVTLGPVSLRLVTIIIAAAAALMALVQSTSSATKAYEVTKLEQIKTEKESDVDMTNTEIARLKALNNNSAVTGQTASPTPAASPTDKLEAPKRIDSLPVDINANLSQLPTDRAIQ